MNADYFRELVDIVAEIARYLDNLDDVHTRKIAGRVRVLQVAMEERRTVENIKQRAEAIANNEAQARLASVGMRLDGA